jgi:putative membrane protein
MGDNPYERFGKEELILRDELAIDRTLLANERTVLAYLRGSLTMVITGITFVHFVEQGTLRLVGLSLVPLGVITGIFGSVRYRIMDRRIRSIRNDLNPK